MEVLAIGLIGLAGKYISERFKNNTDDEFNEETIEEDEYVERVITQPSTGFDQKGRVQDAMDKVTKEKKLLSDDPHNKNIIPTLFNKRVYDLDTENKYLSSTKYMNNSEGDDMLSLYKYDKNLMEAPPNELTSLDEQFSSMPINRNKGPAESNNGKLTLPENWTPFNKNDDDMTYKIFNKDELIHNNMQPFFKDKGLLITEESARNMEQTLDRYTGSSRFYYSKREVSNVENFDGNGFRTGYQPIPLQSYTRGTPVQTDLVQDRYFSGKERRNDKPMDDVKVTPGLNLGAYEDGKVGFHDPYVPPTKTIDELRRLDNPQISGEFPVVKGASGYGKATIIGRVVNKKPVTYGTLSQDYGVMPNFYDVQGPTDQGHWNFDQSHRGLQEEFQQGVIGPVNSEFGVSSENFGKTHTPFNRVLPGLDSGGLLSPNVPNNDLGSYNNYITQRSTSNALYTGLVGNGGQMGAGDVSKYQQMSTNRLNQNANFTGLVGNGGQMGAGDMSLYQQMSTNRTDENANYTGLVGNGGQMGAGDMSMYQQMSTNRTDENANYTGLVGNGGQMGAGDMSMYQQMSTNRVDTNSNYGGVVGNGGTMGAGDMSLYQQMSTNRINTNSNYMGTLGSVDGVSATSTGEGERNMYFRDNKQSLLERLPPTKVNAYQPPNASTQGLVGLKQVPYTMIMGNALNSNTGYLPFIQKQKNINIPSTFPHFNPADMVYNNPYVNNVLYKENSNVVENSDIDSFFNQFSNDEIIQVGTGNPNAVVGTTEKINN